MSAIWTSLGINRETSKHLPDRHTHLLPILDPNQFRLRISLAHREAYSAQHEAQRETKPLSLRASRHRCDKTPGECMSAIPRNLSELAQEQNGSSQCSPRISISKSYPCSSHSTFASLSNLTAINLPF